MIYRFLLSIIFCWACLGAGTYVPEEEWQLTEILPRADKIIAFRKTTSEIYEIWLGIGCLPALLDRPSSIIRIYSTQFSDLSDTEHLGLLMIETKSRNVQCKIMRLKKL